MAVCTVAVRPAAVGHAQALTKIRVWRASSARKMSSASLDGAGGPRRRRTSVVAELVRSGRLGAVEWRAGMVDAIEH